MIARNITFHRLANGIRRTIEFLKRTRRRTRMHDALIRKLSVARRHDIIKLFHQHITCSRRNIFRIHFRANISNACVLALDKFINIELRIVCAILTHHASETPFITKRIGNTDSVSSICANLIRDTIQRFCRSVCDLLCKYLITTLNASVEHSAKLAICACRL